jgi:hypothetical protein
MSIIVEAIRTGVEHLAGEFVTDSVIAVAPSVKVVGGGAVAGTTLLGVGSAGIAAGIPGSTGVAIAGAQMALSAATTAASIPVVGTAVSSAIATTATAAFAAGPVAVPVLAVCAIWWFFSKD